MFTLSASGSCRRRSLKALPHEAPRGLRSTEDLNLGEKLILDASHRVSLRAACSRSQIASARCLSNCFFGEHLEKLTFGGELCLGLVGPHFGLGSLRRALFADIFDVNVWARRRVDDPRSPNGH